MGKKNSKLKNSNESQEGKQVYPIPPLAIKGQRLELCIYADEPTAVDTLRRMKEPNLMYIKNELKQGLEYNESVSRLIAEGHLSAGDSSPHHLDSTSEGMDLILERLKDQSAGYKRSLDLIEKVLWEYYT